MLPNSHIKVCTEEKRFDFISSLRQSSIFQVREAGGSSALPGYIATDISVEGPSCSG